MEEWQNTKAGEWEQKGVLGKIGAWGIESSGRKMKKAEDWQDAAKYQAKIVEETYGTGSLTAGQIKLDTAQRLKMKEEESAAGKERKFAKKETELEHIAEEIDRTENKLNAAKNYEEKNAAFKEAEADLEQANNSKDQNEIATAKEIFETAKKEKELAEKNAPKDETGQIISSKKMQSVLNEYKDVDIYYAQRRRNMLKSKAEAEELKKQIHDQDALIVAAARDAYLVSKRGVDGNYLDQARASQAEEAVKRAGVASYDKSMAKVELINKKILEALEQNKDYNKKISDGNLSDKLRAQAKENLNNNENLIKNLQKELNNLMLANISRGALFGVSGEQIALNSGKRNIHEVGAKLDNQNLMAAQANFLASKLGRDVAASHEGDNGIVKALSDLEQKMGSAYVEQVANALNDMAEQGATHFAGLFKGEMVGGKFKIRATNMDHDAQYVEGKREWAISQSKIGRIHGFGASIDNDVVTNPDGTKSIKPRIKSDAARNNVAKIFASLTSNNLGNVDQNNIDTLALAVNNAETADEIKKIIETIKNVAAGQPGQKAAMINALGKRIAKSSALSRGQNLNTLLEITKSLEVGEEEMREELDELEGAEASPTPASKEPRPPKAPRNTTSRPKR
jgi:hypothetical protein